jgi:hypothetical protein
MKYIFSVLMLTASLHAQGQQEGKASSDISSVPGNAGSQRSQYIRSYPDHFFVWPVLKQRKLDFELKDLDGEKNTLRYKSNKPYSLGIGMYLFELGFEIAFAVPLDEQSKRIYGESKSRDVQLNVLGKKWGADLYYQRYSGFYIDDPANPVPSGMPYFQRPDIETRNIGLTINHTFNSNRFSFRSAYNFAERQLASAGSFIVFASFDNTVTNGDSAIIGKKYISSFGESSKINHIRSSNLGVAPGYTYSLIFKGFFINGALAIGPGNNWMKYQLEDGTDQHNFKVSALVAARIALGFNGDRFFGGLTFMNQGRNAKFENVQFSNSQSAFKILFGFRFRESGILKKKIWDLPRGLIN